MEANQIQPNKLNQFLPVNMCSDGHYTNNREDCECGKVVILTHVKMGNR